MALLPWLPSYDTTAGYRPPRDLPVVMNVGQPLCADYHHVPCPQCQRLFSILLGGALVLHIMSHTTAMNIRTTKGVLALSLRFNGHSQFDAMACVFIANHRTHLSQTVSNAIYIETCSRTAISVFMSLPVDYILWRHFSINCPCAAVLCQHRYTPVLGFNSHPTLIPTGLDDAGM